MTEPDVCLLDLTSAAFVKVLRRTVNQEGDRASAAAKLDCIERDLAHLMETAELSGPAVEQIRTLAIVRAGLASAVRYLQPQLG